MIPAIWDGFDNRRTRRTLAVRTGPTPGPIPSRHSEQSKCFRFSSELTSADISGEYADWAGMFGRKGARTGIGPRCTTQLSFCSRAPAGLTASIQLSELGGLLVGCHGKPPDTSLQGQRGSFVEKKKKALEAEEPVAKCQWRPLRVATDRWVRAELGPRRMPSDGPHANFKQDVWQPLKCHDDQ